MHPKYTLSVPPTVRAYTKVRASDIPAWLEGIESYAQNRLAGMYPKAAAGSATSKNRIKTLTMRIAHLAKSLSWPEMTAHSDPTELLRLVEHIRGSEGCVVAIPKLAKRASTSETAGHIYIVGYSNGMVKLGTTKAERFWGRMGRFGELRRAAARHGLTLDKAYATGIYATAYAKESEIKTVFQAFFPDFTGEFFRGVEWEEACDIADRVLGKYDELPCRATPGVA